MWRHWFFLIVAFSKLGLAFLKSMMQLRLGVSQQLELDETVDLSPKEMARLRHYFLGTTYLCAVYGCLGSTKRDGWLHLSALASFFDDLVDTHREKGNKLHLFPPDPIAFGVLADERKIAWHLLDHVLQKLPPEHRAPFQKYLQCIYAVEIEGQDYGKKELDIKDLKNITAEKGGCSAMLFRTLMHPLPSVLEEKAIFEFGCLVQLSDDIFDIWQDRNQGVATMATVLAETGRVGHLSEAFEEQLRHTKQAFYGIPVSKWRIRTAFGMIHALTAITRACLRRYQHLEENYGVVPMANRKLMVVDMEKWTNRIQAGCFLLLRR